MIKALIVEPTSLAPVNYWRLYRPLQIMRQMHTGIKNGFTWDVKDKVQEGDLMAYDWLIMARPSKAPEMELIATAKKCGLKVAVDYDDDLLNIPAMHPAFGTFYDEARQKVIKSAAAVADVLWCSTESIAQTFGREDAWVIPNAILPSDLPTEPAPNNRIAAWRGREQQYIDATLQMWASGWYDKIKDIPDKWLWMGWMPVPTVTPKSVFLKYDNILKYMDFLKGSGINIMWKPLYDCRFNDGKSNIAWLEATMAGGVCVTNYAGKPGWEYCLPDFDFDTNVLKRKWKMSRDVIYDNYNLYKLAELRLKSLLECP